MVRGCVWLSLLLCSRKQGRGDETPTSGSPLTPSPLTPTSQPDEATRAPAAAAPASADDSAIALHKGAVSRRGPCGADDSQGARRRSQVMAGLRQVHPQTMHSQVRTSLCAHALR